MSVSIIVSEASKYSVTFLKTLNGQKWPKNSKNDEVWSQHKKRNDNSIEKMIEKGCVSIQRIVPLNTLQT